MKRRSFFAAIGGGVLTLPEAVRGNPDDVPVIGYLAASSEESGVPFVSDFYRGLGETGYFVGRNVKVVFRWASGQYERLPLLAAELVALKVAVIAATNSLAAVAARRVTQTTPIAFISGDPVKLGLVSSMNRPDGNATGVNILTPELAPKRLELIRDVLPQSRSVVLLTAPSNPATAGEREDMQAAVRITGHDLQVVELYSERDIEAAFARFADRKPDAVLVGAGPLFISHRDRIITLAAQYAIPAFYDWPYFAGAGGLISYGPDLKNAIRLVGVYAGKILGGAKPADLPVQQPTKFKLVINLKTARALGLTIAPATLVRADEVIE